jgi:hypothetical protein
VKGFRGSRWASYVVIDCGSLDSVSEITYGR